MHINLAIENELLEISLRIAIRINALLDHNYIVNVNGIFSIQQYESKLYFMPHSLVYIRIKFNMACTH